MNFNENIKNGWKMVLKSTNKQCQTEAIIMPTCYCTSNTIYDKHVDVIDQYETHLISIFMKINRNVKSRG